VGGRRLAGRSLACTAMFSVDKTFSELGECISFYGFLCSVACESGCMMTTNTRLAMSSAW
jgi:hypothetical protein